MRWPLRHQILFPMIAVVVTTLWGASSLTAFLAGRRVRQETERQLRDIGRTIDEAGFPLTERVLAQLQGLSGAEFVLADSMGRVQVPNEMGGELPSIEPVAWRELRLSRTAQRPQGACFHAAIQLSARQSSGGSTAGLSPSPAGSVASARVLHVFYPQDRYVRAWWDAVWPPLVVGGIALGLTCGLGFLVAARASRPLDDLRRQVEHIAAGDFSPLPLPKRDDELRDLAVAVNRMAEMLARYEQDVRRSERMRALAQLSGGIAHQLRNTATGCRMALDIHAVECPAGTSHESLEVARRQLALMERYVQRFLTLGKPSGDLARRPVEVDGVLRELLPLVQPAARHAGVALRYLPAASPVWIEGDAGEMEQLVLNLVLNGLEAATRPASMPGDSFVELRCEVEPDWVRVLVSDSGKGPAESVRERLFEPFVTEKPDGVGLGLVVAQEIARQHGGRIRWERNAERTTFVVELPRRTAPSDLVNNNVPSRIV